MALFRYKSKRNLKSSKEPLPKLRRKKSSQLVFVIQEHQARHLHYDLRLEVNGVLKSWAVPKQPSMDPRIKRLAIMVEDHPYAYKDFEGVIPSGYGAGTVKIWDQGTYSIDEEDAKTSEKLVIKGIKKGGFHFSLKGKKLKGTFSLVRLKTNENNQWLLIKKQETSFIKHPQKDLLSNLDKLYWPKEKITKRDLIRYYEAVSPWLLPHLKDRPESLKRFPDGIDGPSFFQKNLKDHPDWIATVLIKHENKEVNYLLIQNEESLIFAANLGCIEIHPFFSRIKTLDNPDFLVFDLDPKGASFNKVIEVAQAIRKVLEEIEVPSYCKTSGATGLHIAVPLGAKYSYDHAKKFAELIAMIVHRRTHKISTLERSLTKRQGKIYIDCYQNNSSQTLAAPYSVRARPGAPVSTPLRWKEVKKGLEPKDFTIKNTLRRVKKVGDLYAPVLGKGINLLTAIKNISLLPE